jgi:hypothetical protein
MNWRFYENIAVDLPAGVEIPPQVAEAAVSVDARRWAARKALDDLQTAREALVAAERHDAAAEAEAAFRGLDPPKSTAGKAAEHVRKAARAAEAHETASKEAARQFLDAVWEARQNGWRGELVRQRDMSREQLIEDVHQIFAGFGRLAVLDHALGALDQLEQSGGHVAGWTLAATPEAADHHRAHVEEVLAAALAPRSHQLGWRTPAPVEDILADLCRHLLEPEPPVEQARALDNPGRAGTTSMLTAAAERAALLGG